MCMPTRARIAPTDELTAPVCVTLRFKLRLPNGVRPFTRDFDGVAGPAFPPPWPAPLCCRPREVTDALSDERERLCGVPLDGESNEYADEVRELELIVDASLASLRLPPSESAETRKKPMRTITREGLVRMRHKTAL